MCVLHIDLDIVVPLFYGSARAEQHAFSFHVCVCVSYILILKPRSHFWMALLEGKKRWLLYPKEQAPLLHPVWPEGCHDPVFEADMETPDAVRTPAALLARGFEGILEAGATCLMQRLVVFVRLFRRFFRKMLSFEHLYILGENSIYCVRQ